MPSFESTETWKEVDRSSHVNHAREIDEGEIGDGILSFQLHLSDLFVPLESSFPTRDSLIILET